MSLCEHMAWRSGLTLDRVPKVGHTKALGFVCISGMDVIVTSPRELEIVITTPKRPYHLFFEKEADHKEWLQELVRANGDPC